MMDDLRAEGTFSLLIDSCEPFEMFSSWRFGGSFLLNLDWFSGWLLSSSIEKLLVLFMVDVK